MVLLVRRIENCRAVGMLCAAGRDARCHRAADASDALHVSGVDGSGNVAFYCPNNVPSFFVGARASVWTAIELCLCF